MRRPTILEVIFALAALAIVYKVIKYPDYRLGCDGWHERKQVDEQPRRLD